MTEDEIKKREDEVLEEARLIEKRRQNRIKFQRFESTESLVYVAWDLDHRRDAFTWKVVVPKQAVIEAVRAALLPEGGEA